jgi:hypothetical protein
MTKYVIERDGVYVKNHPSGFHYTESIELAMTFETMTGAIAYATMHLGLATTEYTVGLVHEAIGA